MKSYNNVNQINLLDFVKISTKGSFVVYCPKFRQSL